MEQSSNIQEQGVNGVFNDSEQVGVEKDLSGVNVVVDQGVSVCVCEKEEEEEGLKLQEGEEGLKLQEEEQESNKPMALKRKRGRKKRNDKQLDNQTQVVESQGDSEV